VKQETVLPNLSYTRRDDFTATKSDKIFVRNQTHRFRSPETLAEFGVQNPLFIVVGFSGSISAFAAGFGRLSGFDSYQWDRPSLIHSTSAFNEFPYGILFFECLCT
jgi:hypothetical protein